jgi:hypothetical protein
MNNDEWFTDEKDEPVSGEAGSDELLSDEDLRLPESANILVRLHAVRAWLTRRQQEMTIEMGEAALELEEALAQPANVQEQGWMQSRPRRRDRERASQEERVQRLQQAMLAAQEQQSAYEEAQTLLEDYIAHTSGERVLVEYYLALEDLVQAHLHTQQQAGQPNQPELIPWLRAMLDVQDRIERVGTPNPEDE